MDIKILYDNDAGKGFKGDWGFSCLIELPKVNKKILFDTGAKGEILLSNIKKFTNSLKIENIEKIDIIFLSHEHWDHIGGLVKVLENFKIEEIYLLKSFSETFKNEISSLCNCKINEVLHAGKIIDDANNGVFTTGEIGNEIKEQSLILNNTLITGCAHPGIVEITKKAKEISGKVNYILGGFHLMRKNEKEIFEIISKLKEINVKRASPCHCSGELAKKLFKENFIFEEIYAGKEIKI